MDSHAIAGRQYQTYLVMKIFGHQRRGWRGWRRDEQGLKSSSRGNGKTSNAASTTARRKKNPMSKKRTHRKRSCRIFAWRSCVRSYSSRAGTRIQCRHGCRFNTKHTQKRHDCSSAFMQDRHAGSAAKRKRIESVHAGYHRLNRAKFELLCAGRRSSHSLFIVSSSLHSLFSVSFFFHRHHEAHHYYCRSTFDLYRQPRRRRTHQA